MHYQIRFDTDLCRKHGKRLTNYHTGLNSNGSEYQSFLRVLEPERGLGRHKRLPKPTSKQNVPALDCARIFASRAAQFLGLTTRR